jgi:hypothetical protein
VLLGLEAEEDVLRLLVPGLEREGLLGELQRHRRVALGELLLHDPAHAHEAGPVVGEEPLVDLLGLLAVARHLGRLRGDEVRESGRLR